MACAQMHTMSVKDKPRGHGGRDNLVSTSDRGVNRAMGRASVSAAEALDLDRNRAHLASFVPAPEAVDLALPPRVPPNTPVSRPYLAKSSFPETAFKAKTGTEVPHITSNLSLFNYYTRFRFVPIEFFTVNPSSVISIHVRG